MWCHCLMCAGYIEMKIHMYEVKPKDIWAAGKYKKHKYKVSTQELGVDLISQVKDIFLKIRQFLFVKTVHCMRKKAAE